MDGYLRAGVGIEHLTVLIIFCYMVRDDFVRKKICLEMVRDNIVRKKICLEMVRDNFVRKKICLETSSETC